VTEESERERVRREVENSEPSLEIVDKRYVWIFKTAEEIVFAVSMTGLFAELRRVQRCVESKSKLKSDADGDRTPNVLGIERDVEVTSVRYP